MRVGRGFFFCWRLYGSFADGIWWTPLVLWIDDRFLYDGERINEDDTPASLDMEDNGETKCPLSKSNAFCKLVLIWFHLCRYHWCHGRASVYSSYATSTFSTNVDFLQRLEDEHDPNQFVFFLSFCVLFIPAFVTFRSPVFVTWSKMSSVYPNKSTLSFRFWNTIPYNPKLEG